MDASNVFASMGKNVNIYWIGATTLAIWFLFLHAPPLLKARNALQDAPFMLHLAGAYSIYLACIGNTLITPSVQRNFHVWSGRVGMIMGIIGFVAGLYLCYWPFRVNRPPLDFSIGITIGGIAQILLQINGYLKIRKFQELRDKLTATPSNNNLNTESDTLMTTPLSQESRDQLEEEKRSALKGHIGSMIALFVIACGVPAAIRVAGMLGAGGTSTLVALIVVMGAVSGCYENQITKRLQ